MLHPQALLHDAASPAQRDALLGVLGTTPPDLVSAASCFLEDPVLLHALLRALPLSGERIGDGLREAVTTRIEQLGPDLLTAWLLSRPAPPRSRTDVALRSQSLHAAHIARRITQEAGYAFADDVALAALWSRLAPLLRANPNQGGNHLASSRELNARLADECGCPGLIADALMLADGAEEQITQAHPLVALTWCANRLAANPDNWLDASARICGLPREHLADIVATTGTPSPPAADETSDADATLPAPLSATPPRLVEAALTGFAHKAFAALDEHALRVRYEAAARLLCDQHPFLVVVAEGSRLNPLPLTSWHHVADLHRETAQPLDDEASVLALAVRSQTPTSWHRNDDGNPGRSVRDWQLARWLGHSGFVCIPFVSGTASGAVVVAPERSPLPATEVTRMLVALTACAVSVALQQHQRDQLEQALRDDIEARHREHVRRIAHEARNPLSVIRSYLHLIPQRHGNVAGLSDDLRIVQDEIERLGGLIDATTAPPAPVIEPARCDVGILLRDMRAMLGESLFGNRGIHFELRAMPDLPPVAMPASALRQVMLNLLHNAADILHPGGRCTVALAGELIADGVRCLEIRVIDNGPGLPPERLGDLFSPQPSRKGGQHQGLGLSITHDLLAQWHARILCRSQHSVGTSFQLLVPVVSE